MIYLIYARDSMTKWIYITLYFMVFGDKIKSKLLVNHVIQIKFMIIIYLKNNNKT